MKGRAIVIDIPDDRASQAALIIDGKIEDLLLDPRKGDATPVPGEIHWAKVDRLVPRSGGAFLTLAPNIQGYLRDLRGVKAGEGILVQVSGFAEPGKASPVTSRLLYKGALVIHTPDAPGINVSRTIRDAKERERLAAIVAGWAPGPEIGTEPALALYREMHATGGFIVRSAASGIAAELLLGDTTHVLAQRSERESLTRSTAPGTTSAKTLSILLALREWAPFARIVTTSSARPLLQSLPAAQTACRMAELEANHPDPFDHFGVWDEIERLKSPRVDLPSGGWMAIEATRAMVTVDVNTATRFSDGAAMTANIEAARELPRQLRLRGLGGQVAIDFAPLTKMQRRQIEEVLKAACRRDPIATTLAGWTPLGNFELQRKRERRPLAEVL